MNIESPLRYLTVRYVIRKNRQGKFWFRIVSDKNNKILAASELYNEKSKCQHAIALIKVNAETAPVVDMTHETTERGSV